MCARLCVFHLQKTKAHPELITDSIQILQTMVWCILTLQEIIGTGGKKTILLTFAYQQFRGCDSHIWTGAKKCQTSILASLHWLLPTTFLVCFEASEWTGPTKYHRPHSGSRSSVRTEPACGHEDEKPLKPRGRGGRGIFLPLHIWTASPEWRVSSLVQRLTFFFLWLLTLREFCGPLLLLLRFFFFLISLIVVAAKPDTLERYCF